MENQNMKSQVSFKFDGSHNEPFVINILKKRLKGVKYKVVKEAENVYRIYVASLETKEETFQVCYSMQCFCVYDTSRKL